MLLSHKGSAKGCTLKTFCSLYIYGLRWWALQLRGVCFIVGNSAFRQCEQQVSMNAWQTKLKYKHVARLLSVQALLLERSEEASRLNLHCDG